MNTLDTCSARSYGEIVLRAARDCYSVLPYEELLYLRMHPRPIGHHLHLGASIRHDYAPWFEEAGVPFNLDTMSDDVFQALLPLLLPEYAAYPLCYKMFAYQVFCDMHAYFMMGYYPAHLEDIAENYSLLEEAFAQFESNPYDPHTQPDEWIDYADQGDASLALFMRALATKMWNFPEVKTHAAERYGIDASVVDAHEAFCRQMLHDGKWNGGRLMPAGLAYLHHQGPIDAPDLDAALRPLLWFLDNKFSNGLHLPPFLFESRPASEALAAHAGRLLENMPRFQDDDNVVLLAVTNDPNALAFASKRLQNDRTVITAAARNAYGTLIFHNPVMEQYNDDDFLVGLACTANGANLLYASKRLRDDELMASIALHNITETYPFAAYQALSLRLKNMKSFALLVIDSGYVDAGDFPASLRDDDDVAAALAASNRLKWQLKYMSKRIRNEYAVQDSTD